MPRRGYRWIAPVARPEDAKPEPVPAAASIQPAAIPARRIAWERPAAAVLALVLLVAGAAWLLTLPERGRRAESAEAQEAYIKGRFFLDQRTPQGVHQAQEQFQRVVSLEPRDPAAHAGLADTYSAMSDFGLASPAEMRPRAMQAAERALELNPQSAEGYAALGRAQFLFDWNFAAAERSLERALTLNPDYMPAHQTLAWLKSAQGQHAEAIAAARRAVQLDPVNTARYRELAWVLVLDGRHGEALGEVERALLLNPRSFETHLTKGWIYEMDGQPDAAFAGYREALRIAGAPDATMRHLEAVYRAEGLSGYYRDWLERQQRRGDLPECETWRAHLYVRAGQFDRAIESLQHAYEKREGALAWVNVEPSFQPLRSDARFQQIAARVGQN